jgi:hypothetical protein
MPALARGQENTPSIINWFISVGGVSQDAYAVEFRIWDITQWPTQTQIFPATPGDYEDVTNAPGKFSTGAYYAYDNTAGEGWTPPLATVVGTHRIEWRWKISIAAPWQGGFEDIEILQESAGGTTGTYITVSDVRAAGLTDETKYPDANIMASIEMWQQFIDRATRQWFNPRVYVAELDGTDSDALHLGVPIIAIQSLQINNSGVDLNPQYYKVYSAIGYRDDRRNPRIKLTMDNAQPSIFNAFDNGRIFRKGRQNQIVKGIFGFVEADGSTPKLIKRALTKLVVEKITRPIYGGDPIDAPPIVTGALLEEWTDGHKYKWGVPGGEISKRRPGLSGITTDPEILDILKLYRAPIGVATPANPSFR